MYKGEDFLKLMTRVLIIDNDLETTRLLREHLSLGGYEVETAVAAKEGLEKALKAPHDLIFLEDVLPDGTAFQVLGKFKKSPRTKPIPIILISRSEAQQATARFIGADDCIVKPFDLTGVDERMRKILGPKAKAAPAAPAAEGAGAKKNPDVPMAGPELMSMELPQTTPETAVPTAGEPGPSFSGQVRYSRRAEDQEWRDFVPPVYSPVPARASVLTKTPPASGKAVARPSGCAFAWILFAAQVTLAMSGAAMGTQSVSVIAQAAMFAAGGMTLLLGLLAALAAAMRIELSARGVVRMGGWAGVPIVLRTFGSLLSLWVPALEPLRPMDSAKFSTLAFWLRPLDIFELSTALIVGLALLYRPGGSVRKSIFAALLIALACSLPQRLHLQPVLNMPLRTRNVRASLPVETSVPPIAAPPSAPAASVSSSAPSPAPSEKPKETKEPRKEVVQEEQLQEFRLGASRQKKK